MSAGHSILAGRLWPQPGVGPVRYSVEIEIAGDRIAAISPADHADSGLVMPALINAHDHGYGLRPMAFGCVDDALEPWIAGLRARPRIDPYLEAVVAFGRMASTGIGTTVHCHNSHNADALVEEAAEVARAAKDVGIRVAFSCPIADRNPWVYGGIDAIRDHYTAAEWDTVKAWQPKYAPAAEQLARVDAVAGAHHTDMFNVQYGPVGPQWCQDGTLTKIADASARTGRRVHMHLLETKRQRAWTDETYPDGIVRYLDDIGLLSPRLTVAHGVWLTPDECALLAERGVTVAVNTTSNLRLRSGLAPVKTFFDMGTRFAIGLDGTAFDDDQDALRDLRLTRLLHGGTDLTPDVPPAAFLTAAFANGNVAFDGDADASTLRPGNRADMLLLDYAAMSRDIIADTADETDVFLTRASARFLKTLTVAGRTIVSNDRLLSVDLPDLERELKAQAEKSAGRLAAERDAVAMHRERIRAFYTGREATGGGAQVRVRSVPLKRRNEELEAQVAERMRVEEKLRDREERLRSILETAPDAIITINDRGVISSFSPPAERLFGYQAHEVLGRNVRILMPSPDREAHDQYIANYLTTGERKIIGIGRQVVARHKEGSTFPINLAVNEMLVDGRRMFTGVIRDITEEQKRQEELRQAQKLTAVGELTGGIAHDFNNILTVIMGNQEMLETQIEGDDQRHMLREAQEAAAMGAELTRRLLAFARRQPLSPRPLDVNALVTDMRVMLERTLGETIAIETSLDGTLRTALADASQVENALLNLAINARDAMPAGGRLIIETANGVLDEDYAAAHPEAAVGVYVRLAVTDSGVGMTPEVMGRAIEPFFTTKDTGEGTGLGLSMIYGFAKQSGGHLNLYSEPGYGTCVSLYLPVAEQAHGTETPAKATGEQLSGHGESILVVEDDARVRRLLIRRLQQLGYVTHEAANGPAAVELMQNIPAVDLVLTDVVMPGGTSGHELAAQIRQSHPNTKILYTSGYPDRGPGAGSVEAGGAMLRKPYDRKTLARKLREVLEA